MKRKLGFNAVLAVLVLLVSACGEQNKPNPGDNEDNNEPKAREIVYTIGHTENRQTLETEGEWDALLEVLCNQARNGNVVTFYNMNPKTYLTHSGANGAKAAKTFSTSDKDEIKAWMKEMEKEGRTVVVTYNNGTWNGVAYATAPPSDVSVTIIGTWHFNCMVRDRLDADGHLQSSDLYVPEDDGGAMFYTFYENGDMSMTFNTADGSSFTDQSTWTLTGDGKLCSDLLLNVSCWDVNWISENTLILSTSDLGDGEDNVLYQMQFDRQ